LLLVVAVVRRCTEDPSHHKQGVIIGTLYQIVTQRNGLHDSGSALAPSKTTMW